MIFKNFLTRNQLADLDPRSKLGSESVSGKSICTQICIRLRGDVFIVIQLSATIGFYSIFVCERNFPFSLNLKIFIKPNFFTKCPNCKGNGSIFHVKMECVMIFLTFSCE